MLCTLLLAAVASAPPAPAAPVTRSVTVGVCTKKAGPVADVRAEEVEVREGGRKRAVLGIEPDRRSLRAAVVVDSSAAVASAYRSELVAAVTSFWKALPAGSAVAVWTSGPPSKVVDFGEDLAAAEPKLQSVAPAGKNYAFEALADACRGLGPPAEARHVVVYVGGAAIEASQTHSAEAMSAVGRAAATPVIALVLAGGGTGGMGGPTEGASFSWDVQGYFERMAGGYRGSFAGLLSIQATGRALEEAGALLAASYRVRYESTTGELPGPEVKVRRKGTKVLVGRTQLEVARID
jgi:hypothetical protein